MFDRHGRLHDARGRFARTGKLRVEALDVGDRPGEGRVNGLDRAAAAFQPPTPAARRRARKNRVTSAANNVRALFARDRSTLSWEERETISYASPRKRDEQRARTGDVIMPKAEAMQRETGLANLGSRRTPRVGLARTFTGRPKVVRGHSPAVGVPLTSRAKQILVAPHRQDLAEIRDAVSAKRPKKVPAAAKMAPKPAPAASTVDPVRAQRLARLQGATFEQARQQLVLVGDKEIRAMAEGLGVAIPKRAGRNQLINLIVSTRK